MKKLYIFWGLIFCFHFLGSAQGFLGKRVHFQFESKFTPAWSNLNFNYKQGVFRFNYHLMPSVEYLINDKWSVSANYQFFETAFKTKEINDYDIFDIDYFGDYFEGYFMENGNRYQGYANGFITTHGGGLTASYYFGRIAPAGYYIKFGVDAFFYNVSVPYSGYDTLVTVPSGSYSTKEEYQYVHKPDIYFAKDWALGIRFELGRNFFIGRYFSLGTSLSCGLLCKGWGNLIYNSNPQFIDYANKRLLTSYIGGISIKIGLLPF